MDESELRSNNNNDPRFTRGSLTQSVNSKPYSAALCLFGSNKFIKQFSIPWQNVVPKVIDSSEGDYLVMYCGI